jgi:hypothetical protein
MMNNIDKDIGIIPENDVDSNSLNAIDYLPAQYIVLIYLYNIFRSQSTYLL